MPSKPKPRPLGHELGPLVYNSKYTRRNGSNTRSNSARSRVNGLSSNSLVKLKESLRDIRNRERRSKGTSLNAEVQVNHNPSREALYNLYLSYSRKNKPKVKGTLKERRTQERKLRGTSLNAANLQGNARPDLPSREALYNQYRGYSAKNKPKPKGTLKERRIQERKLRGTSLNAANLPARSKVHDKDKYDPNMLFIEMDNVLFEYTQEGTRRLKVINDDMEEVNEYCDKLHELDEKYLVTYPGERRRIKNTLELFYKVSAERVENLDTKFRREINQAKKEIRDVFYDANDAQKLLAKHQEIIDKYERVIQSRIKTVDENPHIRLILELYFFSLNNSILKDISNSSYVSLQTSKEKQLKVASETKEVKGNKNKDKYRHVDLFIEMDNVLFEYNELGRRRLKVINDVTDEAYYIEKLVKIDRKYLRTFPEEKEIKRDISMIYEILCKEVEKRDTPFGKEIIQAKKELRDAFYDGKYDIMEVITKHEEIIEKYEKDILSRITSIDEDPYIRLILYLYYYSLLFSYLSLRTTNNSQLSMYSKHKLVEQVANMAGQGLSEQADSSDDDFTYADIYDDEKDKPGSDIPLDCRDCGSKFLFTVDEQAFYVEKGFEGQPSRCKKCRAALKAKTNQLKFANQLRIASESKGVSGRKMELSNANKQLLTLRKTAF